MNLKLFTLGVAALFAGTTFASNYSVKSFPSHELPPTLLEQNRAPGQMQRAPLNPNMNKGTYIFGYTNYDYNGVDNFASVYSSSVMHINKLKNITLENHSFDSQYPRLLMCLGGGWGDGAYYTWRVRLYSMGITMFDNWVKVDPSTGEMTELCEYFDAKRNPLTWPQHIFSDPQNEETVYVNAENDNGTVTSAIWTIDPASGEYVEKVANLSEYYFSVAYDYDGQLYGLRWRYDKNDPEGTILGTVLDVMDPALDYEVVSSSPVLVDGKEFMISYITNNIRVDYTTGDIYWAATNQNGEFYMIQIDPVNNTGHSLGKIGINEWLGGLYIPYQTADSRKAPARVENMSFTVDATGANKVTLNWTNPSTQWNRSKLNDLVEILVYRDKYEGTPVATIPAAGMVGKQMSWIDETASNGVHTYYIVACAKKGEKGVPRSIDAFVGKDVPGPVQNLNARSDDGRTVTVSWERPSIGDSDGWYDAESLSYTITRMPDNVNLGTVTTNSYTDKDIEEINAYSYIIVANNAKGSGSPVESNQVLAGKSINPPFSTDFSTKIEADRFTIIDKNRDGMRYEFDFSADIYRYVMKLLMSNHSNDDILVSPVMKLKKDQTYKLTYNIGFNGYGTTARVSKHPIKILGGTQPTEEGLSTVLHDDPDYQIDRQPINEDYIVYFKSPIEGDYYLGFNILTANEADMWHYISGFSIEPVAENDLQAVSVESHLSLSTLQENKIVANIYNNGNHTESAYKVKLAYLVDNDIPMVFAETDKVPEIASHASASVEFNAIFPVAGERKLVAMVELLNDGYPANDISTPLEVSGEDADALSYSIDWNENNSVSTNIPLNHFNNYTACQTIYTPALTSFDKIFKGMTPEITRIAWEYNGMEEFDGTNINVYLSQTDRKFFEVEDNEWIPVSGEPNFSGEFPVRKGFHYFVADFEKPFVLDPSRPFVVTVTKAEQGHAAFLVKFNTIDQDWETDYFHSAIIAGSSPIDVVSPTGMIKSHPDAPVLHIAVNPNTVGIENIALTGNGAVYYNGSTRTIESVELTLTSVDVYDISGKLVAKIAANDNRAYVNVAPGLYLLKANTIDGRTVTIKANVR